MKRIFTLLTLMLALATFSFAQTEQGNFLVGGGASYSFDKNKFERGSTTTDVGKSSEISFNPNFGYFVINGLAVGLSINLNSSKFEAEDNGGEVKSSSVSFGPFVKYYHSSNFFGMAGFGVGSGRTESTGPLGFTSESEWGVSNWIIGGGYAIFLNDNVSIEPMLSYGSVRVTDKDEDPEEVNIDNGLTFSIGFQIFL